MTDKKADEGQTFGFSVSMEEEQRAKPLLIPYTIRLLLSVNVDLAVSARKSCGSRKILPNDKP